MSDSLISVIGGELEELLEPITLAVDDLGWLGRFLVSLGINTEVNTGALVNALGSVLDLKQQLTSLASNDSPSFDEISGVLNAANNVFKAVRAIESSSELGPAFENLAADLVQALVTSHLSNAHPLFYRLMQLLTVIELAESGEPISPIVSGDEVLRLPMAIERIRPKRIIDLLRDPIVTLKAEYVNDLATVADADAMADKLFPRVSDVLTELGVPTKYGLPKRDRAVFGDAAPLLDHALTIFLAEKVAGAPADIGFTLAFSSADRGDLGLVITPFGAVTQTFEVGKWKFKIDFTADVEALAYGKNGFVLAAGVSTTEIGGGFAATLAAPDSGPAFVLGSPTGSRLEIGGAEIKVATSLSEAQQTLAISGDVSKSAIVIARGDGDSFINSILPPHGLKAEFDLGLAWSNTGGFSLRGGAGLEADLPIGLSFAGITLSSVHISLQADDDRLRTEASLSMSIALGPLQAAVDRIGLTAALSFPEDGGNLGVADLGFGFKPPNGVGLSFDAGGFTGGGFLRFDPEKGEYVGALELDFNNLVSVKAIGIINTKMPDGRPGFSLLIVISAEFTPIQLSFGFTLNGVGGIFGLNRGIVVAALAEGIRTNAIKSILFPENIVANISRIISDIKQFFPQQRDHFVIGPMAKLAWGTSSIITVELGLLLDLPDPMFAIVGVLKALLPDQEAPILKLQVNFIGVVDFDRGYVFFRADLFDSRLLVYSITGSMAFLVSWGEAKALALSVGGFHPDFRDIPCIPALPDGFRHMARIGISLLSDDNPRLKAESYFAVTSNTVQFGARVELYAEESGFNIYGFLGFDVLFQFDPFHFIAKLSGGVALRRHSSVIAGVNISATLTGPTPWDARGKATLSFLFFSISVGFHATWGDPLLAIAGAFEDLLKVLQRELADTRNWRADLPPNNHLHVSVRKIELPAATDMLVIHPAGVLTFSQRSLPLEDFAIQKFGNKKPLAENKFKLTSANSGGAEIPADYQGVREQFAPANFLELSDSEKLSRKSFDNLPSGFKLTATADLLTTLPVVRDVVYELSYLRRQRIGPKSLVNLVVVAYDRLVKGSAVRRSGLAQQQTRVSLNAPPQVELLQETFVIANAADLKSHVTNASGPVFFNSQAEAYQQQQELIAQNPALAGQIQVVSNFELSLN